MKNKIAIIEFGSNAIRTAEFLIKGKDFEELMLERIPQRLIQDLGQKRIINQETTEKIVQIINNFLEKVPEAQVYAIATAALRSAENKSEFIDEIKQQTGVEIEIIPPDQEAYFDFLAVEHKLNLSDLIIADIGGGSSELIAVTNKEMIGETSINFGGVNVTNEFFSNIPVSKPEQQTAKQKIRKQLEKLTWLKNFNQPMVMLGGASIVLFKLLNQNDFVPTQEINDKITELQQLSVNELKELDVIPPGTVDVINGGLTIMNEIIEFAQPSKIITIKASVREGFLLSKIGE
ncbi:hypothetical protein Q2T76_01020 [Lactobacillus sp. YT155]|uniref:Ppx/GppA phosphatase family protein n=1 Tax=Lactobacillus sp. YT155 TaxID=3060955 RepID=UPI00265F22B9|nr:hypothetical protein [Lactobacillus sp. YT155]MDO1604631.1 hypothetical protein [Lactobacillus sp. YT155]